MYNITYMYMLQVIYIYIVYIYIIYIIYIYIYIQKTNIKRNCDTLIQSNYNKTTIDFEHSCVLLQWSTVGIYRQYSINLC